MFDHSRLVRLITVALASCAMTWAIAGAALARPDSGATTSEQSSAPPFQPAPGDTNKAPSATSQAPAFQAVAADTDKTPNPRQVQGVLNGLDQSPQPADTTDDTGTVALIIAIVAIMTAIGAVTLTITRTNRPMLGA